MSTDHKSPDAVTSLNLDLQETDQAARLGDVAKRLHSTNNNTDDRNAKRARTSDSSQEDSNLDDESDGERVISDTTVATDQEETKETSSKEEPEQHECSYCGWHHFIMDSGRRCSKCGRLASHTKEREEPKRYVPKDTDIDFGERTFGFRIVEKDVSADDKYRSNWETAKEGDPSWQYDEAAMKQSVFDIRIGSRPTAKSILELVSEWDEETSREINDNDYIILDNPDEIALLLSFGDGCDRVYFNFRISASWDRKAMTGTFTMQLFLKRACLGNRYFNNDNFAFIIGCWFKLFPLDLASLSGTLKAHSPDFHLLDESIPRPKRSTRKSFEAAAAQQNRKVDQLRSSLSLTPSSDNYDIVGFSTNDTTPKGILTSFYRELVAYKGRIHYRDRAIFPSFYMLNHRYWDRISNHNSYGRGDLGFLLKYSDQIVAKVCLKPALDEIAKRGLDWHPRNHFSMLEGDFPQGVLACLENLGHEPELTCEGLAVELLDFQKQSLKWAMERETTPGGIQSYFWFKLPIKDVDLYFNPMGGWFRKGKPREVRGGIIADEMGLGKTIVSLALILKHPAPESPISGSNITCLSNVSDDGQRANLHSWKESLYQQTFADNKLRGSIMSRGTLVVCPVSVVGQWVEEAKSKLSNPGLIYPYYGSKRTRDVKKISTNSIVVTTYQVLVSDNTYHRKKSSNPESYCPPLEQVRWWRIICDEGHALRSNTSKQTCALARLVADHKWIVTGTPLSTSVMDLKTQLKFLGIEQVDRMFDLCHIGGISSKKGEVVKQPGMLRFLLRNIMIRHTHKQCYRGTTTTLMSLPPKSERSIDISLPDDERREYDSLDQSARDFYLRLKATHAKKISSHYMLLSQKLNPLRVACSGGHPPLNPEVMGDEDDDNDGDMKVQLRKEIKYSEFCFTAKVKVLIEELKKARDEDPESKSLVFSHFISTLECLKKELPKHGFQYRTLTGRMSMKQRAKALHDFQNDPPTTIFLLSMRAGNCGINLTQANRVFLMEPGFNPSVEKQAIGRVHRLGQKRNVEVIRLFVKDSIETRIQKFLEAKYGNFSSDNSNESSNVVGGDNSAMVENPVIESVGNLATEKPKNKMVVSEFDLLFGVESESGTLDAVAMPDAAISSDFL